MYHLPFMIQRGIFRSRRRACLALAVYTVVLYSTMTIAFDIYVYYYNRLGHAFMSKVMSLIYLPVGIVLLGFIGFSLPRRLSSYFAFLLICLGMVYCLNFITVPAKRFHFLQYSPLTLLVFDALRFKHGGRYLYMWTFAVVLLVGLGDEILQGLMPKRHFGIQDIGINSMAGLLTLVFIGFVISEENYPWGKMGGIRLHTSAKV